MGYLRLVRPGDPVARAGAECLAAFDREVDYLYVLLQRFGLRSTEIEDLLQEIFVVLYKNWPTLDTTRPLRPWLFGVTFRVVSAYRRRSAREIPTDDIEIESLGRDPEADLQAHEALSLFRAALERVPASRRSVLILHDMEGVEVLEIARQLSMTKFGVYARLYRARKELGSALRRLQNKRVGQ
jgi:RNA polymerase sigma-70 factor (ECF subfamily)